MIINSTIIEGTSVSEEINRVMLPFDRHQSATFRTLSELQSAKLFTGSETLRPTFVYGAPSAGKSTLKTFLEENGIGVIDTDDLVRPAMERQARRFINSILRDHSEQPGRAWNALALPALTSEPSTLISALAWGELNLPTTVRDLRKLARVEVDSKLAKADTYQDIQVVVTNLRNFEYYDFGFARDPAQASLYISLFPNMELELLEHWFADSKDAASRARDCYLLGKDEHILTVSE